MKKSFLALIFTVLLQNFAAAQVQSEVAEYILKYQDLVLESAEKYGIPASVKMAQAILESGNGTSRLAKEANNHFGIKCKSDWKGKTISHDDDAKGECFRKYNSAKASFVDHSEFLDEQPRYQFLFKLKATDYKGWAKGLKQAGYATSPTYTERLIEIIERYELYTLDTDKKTSENVLLAVKNRDNILTEQAREQVEKIDTDNYMVSLRSRGTYSVYANNGSEFILADSGDDMQSLALKLKISSKRLTKYNDLKPDAKISAGDKIYISSKSKRSLNGKMIHSVTDSDNLWSLSQKYGIRLKNLSKMNKLSPESKLHQGQQIRLM
ncbi:MAG: glucosaminidase domain-containing protein [Rikenellaceae bacterium]